ncbi:unnamed protein product [Calicophoron daubneyi]|uniref:RRP1-like protein n=1 Tax=Calicophoron daubneyi TaxID=300641 RepID=A0AAV2T0K9_CALDB
MAQPSPWICVLAKSLSSDKFSVRKAAQLKVSDTLCKFNAKRNGHLTYLDVLALCKGLHYSLWMQDKLLLKEEVVKRICSILPEISDRNLQTQYFTALFEILAREWDHLDNWRVDKFMLLARDFFTTGLRTFPLQSPESWDSFVDAIFEKILNADIQHALGLKMHMCNLLNEELSKPRVKAFCVVAVLDRMIKRLTELPRRHVYTQAFLLAIHQLLKNLKKHSNTVLDELMNTVNVLSKQRSPHRKSLKRISQMLTVISNRREKKAKGNVILVDVTHVIESNPALFCPSTEEMSSNDSGIPTDTEENVKVTKKKVKKRRRKELSENNSPKKARLIETDEISCATGALEGVSPVDQQEISVVSPPCEIVSPEIPRSDDLGQSNEVSSPPRTPEASLLAPLASTLESERNPTKITPKQLSPAVTSPKSSSRRVSFGKVFRKKFVSTRRLSMTPSPKVTTPSKGILRGIFATYVIV